MICFQEIAPILHNLQEEMSKFLFDFHHIDDEVCYGGFRIHKDFIRTDDDFICCNENPELDLEEFLAGEER